MTCAQARDFLSRKHAERGLGGQWQIAHDIGGELEWFTVTEEDAQLFDRLAGVEYGASVEK